MRDYIYILLALCFGFVVGMSVRSCHKPSAEPIVIHDTIKQTDTAYIERHTTEIKQLPADTIYIPIEDTTISVAIPISSYAYKDTIKTDSSSIEMDVYFSGYKAKIDSTALRYHFDIQPQVVERKRGWGQFIGIGAGVGVGGTVAGGHVYAGPQVGISIVYGIGYHW